jgi:hypothetical protein
MGPKRGGRHARPGGRDPRQRRDRGKTWDEEADHLEANVGRLKLENEASRDEDSCEDEKSKR